MPDPKTDRGPGSPGKLPPGVETEPEAVQPEADPDQYLWGV